MNYNLDKYQIFLNTLEKRISEKEFEKRFLEIQEIDLNHYTKKISIDELKKIIQTYRNKNHEKSNYKNVQILLPGNPEIVFNSCLYAISKRLKIILGIQDFCLAQNTIIIETINDTLKSQDLKVEIKNLMKDSEIINFSKKVDKTICIGDSNLFNRLEDKINNFQFYPYGILELYSDSEEFEELKRNIYEYSIENQFELEIYDDLNFDEAIKIINKQGYKFCSLLLSKDKEKIKKFKDNIISTHVIVNENPFEKMQFNLNI